MLFIFGLLTGTLTGFFTAALFSINKYDKGRFSRFTDRDLKMLKKHLIESSAPYYTEEKEININYESGEWKNYSTLMQEINDEMLLREQLK